MGTSGRRVSVKEGRSKLVKWDDLRMEIIFNPGQNEIKMAAKALKDGHLVAFPTETVYGLGADATNIKAVSRVYSVKDRPTDHPLIVHISSINLLQKWALDIPEYAIKLAKEFWPGPMTLILKRNQSVQNFITGGQDNVGVRVPAHPIALGLLSEFENMGGEGIAAPSANRFRAISPTTAKAVDIEIGAFLKSEDFILDGGQSSVGVESTIIDCTESVPVILRPGAVTSEMIENLVGKFLVLNINKIKTSGLLESHYSPKAKVEIGRLANPGEGFLALAEIPTPKGAIRLAAPVNIEKYAKDLYVALRFGDQQGLDTIVAIPPEGFGLAEAIRDRLTKASAG
jgi:L-threonylcarbamoyladenylate synthase